MGCCHSTASADPHLRQPVDGHAELAPNNSSQAAINPPAPPIRPNAPIRAPSSVRKSPSNLPQLPPPWTRSQLEAQRAEFFDTRVTGIPEAWQALREVCQLVRRAGRAEMADAQALLDASGLTCPHGRIARGRSTRDRSVKGGIYDEAGNRYDIPDWVLADPEDTVEDEGEKEIDSGGAADGESDDEGAGAPESHPQRHKGKERARDIGEVVHLRARLSDRSTDVVVEVGMLEPIGVVTERIREQARVQRVQLMYLGHKLADGTLLGECGWKKDDVLNAMVFDATN